MDRDRLTAIKNRQLPLVLGFLLRKSSTAPLRPGFSLHGDRPQNPHARSELMEHKHTFPSHKGFSTLKGRYAAMSIMQMISNSFTYEYVFL